MVVLDLATGKPLVSVPVSSPLFPFTNWNASLILSLASRARGSSIFLQYLTFDFATWTAGEVFNDTASTFFFWSSLVLYSVSEQLFVLGRNAAGETDALLSQIQFTAPPEAPKLLAQVLVN
jgi:hypothetical protein